MHFYYHTKESLFLVAALLPYSGYRQHILNRADMAAIFIELMSQFWSTVTFSLLISLQILFFI